MRILIVDDRSEKAAKISRAIESSKRIKEDGIQCKIDISLSLQDAKGSMRKKLYDLLILDLHMPRMIGDDNPASENGISFVDEICNTASLKIPMDIIAMTALDDAKEKFTSEERLAGFAILQYDETKREWQNHLVSRIQYLHKCDLQRRIERRPAPCDLLWLTTVDVESEAVEGLFEFSPYTVPDDPTHYQVAEVAIGTRTIHIVHAQLKEMGMTNAAAMTVKASMRFRPEYIVMTGIAAGLDDDMSIGDVMFAERSWSYDSGKYTEEKKSGRSVTKLLPDGNTLNMDHSDREVIARFLKEKRNEIKARSGTFACGNAVVASTLKVSEDIKAHNRKTIGIDMESYGVMLASELMYKTRVPAFVLKGISDKADTEKSDKHQVLAANNSATLAKDFIWFLFETVAVSD